MVKKTNTTTAPAANTSYPVDRIQKRLATGLGNKGGARGSLTRVSLKLSGLKRASSENISTACTSVARELKLARVELTKLALLKERQNAEAPPQLTAAAKENDDTSSSRKTVQQLRHTLQQASHTVAAQQEYEQAARLLLQKHPTPPHALRYDIAELKTKLQTAQSELRCAQSHSRIRTAQFQWLLQGVLDLKQSLTEPLLPTGQPLDVNQNDAEEEAPKEDAASAATNRSDQKPQSQDIVAMEVDKPKNSQDKDNDEGNDDGALYDDL